MKDFIKFISKVTGIARSVVTILFLLAIFFTGLVSVNLLLAFVDILGFTGLSAAVIKPIFFLIFALMFVINLIITRNIFRAGKTGDHHLSNLVFALLFLALDAFFFVSLKDVNSPLIYVLFVVNGLIVLNSILGLIARARGLYVDYEKVESSPKDIDYIEFDTVTEDEPVDEFKIKVDTNSDNQKKVIKQNQISATGKIHTEDVKNPKADKKEDRVLLEKDQKMVFGSSGSVEDDKNNGSASSKPSIKRVAKKKSADQSTRPIPVSEASNKINRSNQVSDTETYQSDNDEN